MNLHILTPLCEQVSEKGKKKKQKRVVLYDASPNPSPKKESIKVKQEPIAMNTYHTRSAAQRAAAIPRAASSEGGSTIGGESTRSLDVFLDDDAASSAFPIPSWAREHVTS